MRFIFIIAFLFLQLVSFSQTSPGKELWTVSIDYSGKFAATGGDDQIIRLYQYEHLKLLKAYWIGSTIRKLEWQPNGQLLAVATGDKKMHIRNMITGDSIPLAGSEYGGRGLSWSYNGKFLAVTDNHLIKIWSENGKLVRTISQEDKKSYFDIDWHPTKNILLVSGDDIRLYDISGKKIKVLKHREEKTGVLTVEWHPSGRFFVSGDYGHEEEGIPTLLQYWTQDGKLFKTIKESKAEYRDMKWNADGTFLATASDRLRIWNKEGELVYIGESDNKNLWAIAWNNFEKELVTISFSGVLAKWNYKAKLLQRFE
jgi:WD40 repeat protein